jgi:hypothetical protein
MAEKWYDVWRSKGQRRKAHIGVEKNIFRRMVEIYAAYNEDSHHHFLTPEGVVSCEIGTVEPQDGNVALVQLLEDEAQDLFQSLWDIGHRPKDMGKSEQGQVAAMQNHIDDLRKLVEGLSNFDTVNVENMSKIAKILEGEE